MSNGRITDELERIQQEAVIAIHYNIVVKPELNTIQILNIANFGT
jgi:hypothetical protein